MLFLARFTSERTERAEAFSSPGLGPAENMLPFPPHTRRRCPKEGRSPQKAGRELGEQSGIQPHFSVPMLLSPPQPQSRGLAVPAEETLLG